MYTGALLITVPLQNMDQYNLNRDGAEKQMYNNNKFEIKGHTDARKVVQ